MIIAPYTQVYIGLSNCSKPAFPLINTLAQKEGRERL
jgi:hypothetical protein